MLCGDWRASGSEPSEIADGSLVIHRRRACAVAPGCYGPRVSTLRRRAVVSSLAAAALLVPLRAAADDGVDVSWAAPDDCPSSAELRRRVTTRVPGGAALVARGRVQKRRGRYRLALDIATASSRGERELDASTCEELASSAAVVIAMSVAPPAAPEPDGEADAAGTSPTAATDTTTTRAAPAPAAPFAASPAARSPDQPTAPPSARAGDRASRFLVRAQVAGDSGLLPSASVGGGLALGVVVTRDLAIEASANVFGSQDGTLDGTPARGASFSLLSAGARACWTLTHGIEIAPCAGFEVARIAASGFGAARVNEVESVTWGPEVLLTGRIPVAGPLSLRLGIGGVAPISLQSFVINAAGTVHEPGAVALRTWAGPEVRF